MVRLLKLSRKVIGEFSMHKSQRFLSFNYMNGKGMISQTPRENERNLSKSIFVISVLFFDLEILNPA